MSRQADSGCPSAWGQVIVMPVEIALGGASIATKAAILVLLAATGMAMLVAGSEPALAQQVALGPDCDPNYDMACVPIARDVDCAGGNGNGPAYVQGPVRVVGRDIYGLDRNDDGYGCEPLGWKPSD